MKYSTVLTLAAFAAGASAQVTRADFPACALTCLQEAIASETDCTVDDVSCSCEPANNAKVRTVATPCVLTSCQGDDITKTLQVSEQICAPGNNAGGSGGESQTSSAAEETTTATETAEETATETASETATESATETTTATQTDDDAEETSTAAPVVPAPTGNTTAPTEAPPTFTGAAGKVGATLGSVAMAALAALAL